MQRRLTFNGERCQRRFDFCRESILAAGGATTATGRGREVIRKEARLLDALDDISMADPVRGGEFRTLTAANMVVEFAQDDFALLIKYVDSMPWLPRVSREAVDVQDWLSAAEQID